MLNNYCSICNEFQKNTDDKIYSEIKRQWYNRCGTDNRILYEDADFVVIPSLGPIAACHFLMLPKLHANSFALLSEEQLYKAEKLLEKICSIIEKKYGKSIVFEHGTLKEGMQGSASCDHAHLHIISCDWSLRSLLQEKGFYLRKIKSMEQLKKQSLRGLPYFYYRENESEAYIMDDIVQKSQYMRILIAEVLRIPEKADWKKDWGLEEMTEMFLTLKNDFDEISEVHIL